MDIIDEFFLEIHAAEHCNLGCAGCTHFSPLAKEEYCDIDLTASALSRLIQLARPNIRAIHVMGGEPLLYPHISELLKTIRDISGDQMSIELVTNGILLDKMMPAFWDACRTNSIIIRPTIYPIDVDYHKLEELAKGNDVQFLSYSRPGEIKTFKSFPLDLDGRQDRLKSFDDCKLSRKFLLLKRGYLYICSIAANIDHFNGYFDLDLERCEEDRIDVFHLNTLDDLITKVNTAIPFCRYCNVSMRKDLGCWRRSKYRLEEWASL